MTTNNQINNAGGGGSVTSTQVQQTDFNYAVDSGTANTYAGALSPTVVSLTDALPVWLQIANSNSGASTLALDATGAQSIVNLQGTALGGGELIVGNDALFIWNATNSNWVLQNSALSSGGGVTALQVQQTAFNYAPDTAGTPNTYVVDLSPAVTSLTEGLQVWFTASSSNTGGSTLNLNGLGAVTITNIQQFALIAQEIQGSSDYLVVYYENAGPYWVLQNSSLTTINGPSETQVQQQAFNFANDTGAANAYVVTLSPVPGSLTEGLPVQTLIANSNTGASTLNLNGLGPTAILDFQGNPLAGGELVANTIASFIYNGSSFWLQNAFANTYPIQAPSGIQSLVGKNLFTFTYTASAVNYFAFTNNVTGSAPVISAQGSDSNIILQLNGKGTGGVALSGTSTNDNAGTGQVGEFISNEILIGSPVTMASNAATNLTSISLTAGDWDVYGNINYATLGTSPSGLYVWISTTSATAPIQSRYNDISTATGATLAAPFGISAPYTRISITSTTTVYLSGFLANASGTGTACGGIYARRAR